MCLAVPAQPHPLVFDMATSVLAMGKVKVAHDKGESIPHGVLLDGAGDKLLRPLRNTE